jgi:hypothetical protein
MVPASYHVVLSSLFPARGALWPLVPIDPAAGARWLRARGEAWLEREGWPWSPTMSAAMDLLLAIEERER